MRDKEILEILKSTLELKREYNFLDSLICQLSDVNISNAIRNELDRSNFGSAITLIDEYLYQNTINLYTYCIDDIKKFDFNFIDYSTIEDIKSLLNISTLNLYHLKTGEGNDLDYLKYWDNTNRFMVIIKRSLVKEIKSNPEIKLNITKEFVLANLGYYTKFKITNAEEDSRIERMQAMDNEVYSDPRFEDSTDWSLYNDDLDPDHQDPDFWNQF